MARSSPDRPGQRMGQFFCTACCIVLTRAHRSALWIRAERVCTYINTNASREERSRFPASHTPASETKSGYSDSYCSFDAPAAPQGSGGTAVTYPTDQACGSVPSGSAARDEGSNNETRAIGQ